VCGIAGYKCFGTARPTEDMVRTILLEISNRGQDATGLGYIKDNKIYIGKDAIPADKFLESEIWSSHKQHLFGDNSPHTVIFHTRSKTKGSQANSKNNHPVWSKINGCVLVHNGIIRNDDEIIKELKWSREGEVDSEAILAIMDQTAVLDAAKELGKLEGSMALAAISTSWPDHLILYRHSNPIVFSMDDSNDILFFASTVGAIVQSTRVNHRGFSCTPSACFEIKEDIAIIIGKEGVEETSKIVHKIMSYSSNTKWNGHDWEGGQSWSTRSSSYQTHCENCKKLTQPEWNFQAQAYECKKCKKKGHPLSPVEKDGEEKGRDSSVSSVNQTLNHCEATKNIYIPHNVWKKVEKYKRREFRRICKAENIALVFVENATSSSMK